MEEGNLPSGWKSIKNQRNDKYPGKYNEPTTKQRSRNKQLDKKSRIQNDNDRENKELHDDDNKKEDGKRSDNRKTQLHDANLYKLDRDAKTKATCCTDESGQGNNRTTMLQMVQSTDLGDGRMDTTKGDDRESKTEGPPQHSDNKTTDNAIQSTEDT